MVPSTNYTRHDRYRVNNNGAHRPHHHHHHPVTAVVSFVVVWCMVVMYRIRFDTDTPVSLWIITTSTIVTTTTTTTSAKTKSNTRSRPCPNDIRMVSEDATGHQPNGFRRNMLLLHTTPPPATTRTTTPCSVNDFNDEMDITTTTPRTATTTPATQPNRRQLLTFGSATMILSRFVTTTPPCMAITTGEIGRHCPMMTEAITTSELGLAVRRSVVRGAQIMDALDGQAERFSDNYQLGSERRQQSRRPLPKPIPPLRPLDVITARNILQRIDETFASIASFIIINKI